MALQHSECEEDLGLVSFSRVSQFCNAGPGSLSSRVIFIVIILSEEESVILSVNVCVCLFDSRVARRIFTSGIFPGFKRK